VSRNRIFREIAFFLVAALMTSFSPQSAVAKDSLIWDKLQGKNPKGYVLLMRHTLAPGVGDPQRFRLGDCTTQRNLSDEGRQDARYIGKWLEQRNLKIHSIESSRWCRTRDTAELLGIGRVKLNKNLDSLFRESDLENHKQTIETKKRIVSHRNTRGLLVLVGHAVNISAITGITLDSGEGILVRANAQGDIDLMGFSPKP
jgi:phosphohistidine phosphatase SixA